jgi:hypothetical protein
MMSAADIVASGKANVRAALGRFRRRRSAAALLLAALALSVALAAGACGSRPAPARQFTESDFNRSEFSNPPRIDNKWLPMTPGTEFIYQGRSNLGHGLLPHRQILTVTDMSKSIDGVPTLVIWDRDFQAGTLDEQELAFFAQDNNRNIWALGEYPEEYERGKLHGAPDTWIAGQAGAKPGINMRGDPRPGTSSYGQGFAPNVRFGDRATVAKIGAQACVPTGCYRNVLETDEYNTFQPDNGHQLKFYAPGVGLVEVAPGRGDTERETLVLVRVTHLQASELAAVRQQVLLVDRRAYKVSNAAYRDTLPAAPITARP